MVRDREYFLALMYHYFLWARIGAGTKEDREALAWVANLLHNMPSIVSVDQWTEKLSQETWNSLYNGTKFGGGHEWLINTDNAIREDLESGRGMLPSWNFHNQ